MAIAVSKTTVSLPHRDAEAEQSGEVEHDEFGRHDKRADAKQRERGAPAPGLMQGREDRRHQEIESSLPALESENGFLS